jgi:hypothetical protein
MLRSKWRLLLAGILFLGALMPLNPDSLDYNTPSLLYALWALFHGLENPPDLSNSLRVLNWFFYCTFLGLAPAFGILNALLAFWPATWLKWLYRLMFFLLPGMWYFVLKFYNPDMQGIGFWLCTLGPTIAFLVEVGSLVQRTFQEKRTAVHV